jgi:hypothetical protein
MDRVPFMPPFFLRGLWSALACAQKPFPMTIRAMPVSPMKRNLPLVLAVLLLVCVGLGTAALPCLLRERVALVRLQNHIERAAAPDEPVLLDDRWLGWAIRGAGSREATHRLTIVRGDYGLDAALPGREVVLVAHPGDALVSWLRADGYTVMPDTSESSWDEAGDGSGLCGHAGVRIYFVLPATPSAGIPSKP